MAGNLFAVLRRNVTDDSPARETKVPETERVARCFPIWWTIGIGWVRMVLVEDDSLNRENGPSRRSARGDSSSSKPKQALHPCCCRLPICVSLARSRVGHRGTLPPVKSDHSRDLRDLAFPRARPADTRKHLVSETVIDLSRSSMRCDVFPGPTDRARARPSCRPYRLLGFP